MSDPKSGPSIREAGGVVAVAALAAAIAVPLALLWPLGSTPEAEPGSTVEASRTHLDSEDGLAITIPASWAFAKDPTRPIEPKNVLAVGSWRFPRGGACAPFAALRDLPAAGAFLWLIEYHGPRHPWDFPSRPEPFELGNRYGEFDCSGIVDTYQVLFQDEGRFFQLQVAFGPDAPDSQVREVLATMESLEVNACDVGEDGYGPAVSPASAPSGARAIVRGEIPHGVGGEGGFPADPTTTVEAWWNLDPADWSSALPGGQEPVSAGPGPVLRLGGIEDAATRCGYDIPFAVPDAPPGLHPVVVIAGSEESWAPFEPASFEVTG
jgi:hypothetical protein